MSYLIFSIKSQYLLIIRQNNNFQQILIQNNNIIYTFGNLITSININTRQNNQLKLDNTNITYMVKLSSNQTKQLDDIYENINQSNYNDNTNESLIFIVKNEEQTIYIIDASQLIVINFAKLDYQIINVVVDWKRRIIFCVSNISFTFIYDFGLKLLSQIKNPCLVSARIFFDDQLIISVCPNSVYFYNSLTLVKQEYQINTGFTSIEYIKSFNSQNTFILLEQYSIYIVQIQQSNVQILFQKNKQRIYIQSASIIFDENNQKYFQIEGISWTDIIYYLIPYQPQNICTYNLGLENQNMNSYQIQKIQQNAKFSNQIVAQVQIQLQNNTQITKFMDLQQQDIKIQVVFYTYNYNTLIWNDGSIVDDPNISQLVIHDALLNVTDKIILNQNNNIEELLLYNVVLIGIQNQIFLENIQKSNYIQKYQHKLCQLKQLNIIPI
ncbi:hypothetical protein TTHERM_000414209 (macronuclear) [Tetrahymena thermophila SB210]|uniref:Uncharacterized protein n=1 Tax=Tetrahymena thermophila (strain SB210) TaxID=312017 RepID=W7XB46_TETTS|nr:hypothetical protein TTHERM_000414209 [Tetrahymena thermophila SB210]EWS76600.1 hypothetical protein TTHERM_000414209 [Tetrahymena thermophila SB210]|eukprot:XP_012650886.1 hypothetical protein TTHERM_000414209 [Tetrahymena thermophila SB210]